MKQGLVVFLVTFFAILYDADALAAEGRTPGQFAVSPTGSAQYSIPIWTPPGPKGIQPNLALVYDSRSAAGSMGVGWQMSGLGAITRCNKTYAQDSVPAPVALVTNDGYCLNGNRLRLTSGSYGAAGSTYQTEIADFSNVTANGAAGNGPAYFTVQTRDGLTYEYGYTDANGNGAHSQVLANGTATADAWLLSKVIDRSGNNMVVNYTLLTGAAVPNTILWTPSSAGASTYAYTLQFNYTSNVPQSSITKYIGGTAVSNNKLLSSISISYSGTIVKDYFLGYQARASPTTGREELISVKECADSAQSNCLLPTSVTYQSGNAGVSTTSTTALTSSSNGLSARYDINGDGYPDLVYESASGTWYVSFGSATGYGTPIAIGINAGVNGNVLVGNITGGNQDGILANKNGTWFYYTWNTSTSSFTNTTTGIPYDTSSYGFQLADIDGDGRPDLIDLDVTYNAQSQTSTANIHTRLNTSTGSSASFSAPTLAYSLAGITSAQLQGPDWGGGKLRHYDFNGDGRDDVVLLILPNTTSMQTYELISTGSAFNATLISTQSSSTFLPVFFTKWNDDACTDFVTGGTLYISGCNGSVAATYPVGNVVAALDWDGDGRTDLVVVNGTTLGVLLSTGAAPGTVLPTSISYASTCLYVTMDANGDGLDDLGCWSSTGSNPLTYYLHNGAGQPPDLMSSIKDGYGNSVSPTYTSLVGASNYAEYYDATFPDQSYVGPLYVASSATFNDPSNMPSGTYIQHYYYYGGWMNLQGRGFEGFYALGTVDSRTVLYENQYYERAFPYTGMKFQDIVANSSFYVKESTATPAVTTLDGTANNERYFPYFSKLTTTQSEVGGLENGDLISTQVTNYTYDTYGNATTVSTVVTDNDPGSPYLNDTWTSTTVNSITPNTGTWCLNQPTETQVTNSSTAPGGAAITRTVSYTPDYTNCRETQKVVEPSSTTYKVTDVYTYDAFGNLWTDTMTGVGMPARVTTLTWGTTGQFLTTAQNPLSQVITLGYDPASGLKTSQTDPNWTATNPIATAWGYDPFQRRNLETRPDGTSTSWAYNSCGATCVNTNNITTVTRTILNVGGSTQSVTNTYLDSMDRTLVTSSTMLNGAYDREEVQYDNLGRVHQQGAPCAFVSCSNYWTSFGYDSLNRLIETERPINASSGQTYCNPATVPPVSGCQGTAYTYQGRTTTVSDALGNSTTHINLVNGALARSKDAKGYYVNFTYDAFGSRLSVIDSASNTLSTATYKYGLKAFKTASTDMDLGPRSYTVDALGEVTAYSDNKSQNFSVIYDALSRPTSRTEPDLTTTWVWGNTASSYNIGRLQSVTGAGSAGSYIEAYGYDSKTRLSTRTLTLPGDATYTYTSTYNATTGLLDTLQYPLSTSSYQLKLQYAYANGLLKSIADYNAPTTVFWTANAANPRGQVTQETLGNGVVTSRSFDAVTSWVSSIQAGVGGGASLLNSAYTFDLIGDVTQRQNNNLGLTENFYYDADYRLDHSQLNGALNLQMTYDTAGMGNIASRSDVAGGAAWTYDPVRKHAVTQAGSGAYTYTYDGNGNALTRNGYNVTWTSYNYPSGMSSAGESTVFQYGPNRDRWQTIYTGSIGTETTYHVGNLLEKVANGGTIDYRHYIFAGSEAVAIYSRLSTGTNTLRYLLSDHLGSFASILTSTGTSIVNESFTAYGNRRSAETWSGAPTSGDETAINGVSREGYTGQTVLGVSMGLNHMNGRVEDAITGRFLSPDPHGIEPSNTQSFNRYSYVQNRPLTLTDPTGFTTTSGNYIDYTNIPSGFSQLSTRIQQRMFQGVVSAQGTFYNANSGDGQFSGMSANDATLDSLDLNPDSGIRGSAAVGPLEAPATVTTGSDAASGGAQSQNSTQSQTASDGLQEITVVANAIGAPAGTPTPPENIPGGPWQWSPNPQNPRGGNFMGPKPPKGPRGTITYSPPTDDQVGYWKTNDPDGSAERYFEDGTPMIGDQKQWPSGPSVPPLAPWAFFFWALTHSEPAY